MQLKQRLDIIKDKNIQGAPDLVMEVLSAGTAYYDLRHKKDVAGGECRS